MQEIYEIETSLDRTVVCDECLLEVNLVDVLAVGDNRGNFSFDWGCPRCEIAHTEQVYLGSF